LEPLNLERLLVNLSIDILKLLIYI